VALLRTLISSSTAVLRETNVAATPVELDNLDWNILPHQGIQIVHRARVGLRSGHESLDPDIHRQPAFDASQHAAREHQLVFVCLVQIVPDAQTRGARVRKQHISFHVLAVVDHDVDRIANLHRDFARGRLELLDGNDAFGLVSEVDDDVLSLDP